MRRPFVMRGHQVALGHTIAAHRCHCPSGKPPPGGGDNHTMGHRRVEVDAAVVGFTGAARHPKALAVQLPDGRVALSQRLTTALASVVAPRLIPQTGRGFTKAGDSYTPAGPTPWWRAWRARPGTPSSPWCGFAEGFHAGAGDRYTRPTRSRGDRGSR